MEEILKYENRDSLYGFLINDFGLKKVDEQYDPKVFGNFYVTLAAQDFLISYANDRSYLDVNIASKLEPRNGFPLSFVRDLIYNPNNVNGKEEIENEKRIMGLNGFLKSDFYKISWLFSDENYYHTKQEIEKLLKKQFIQRNPGLEID